MTLAATTAGLSTDWPGLGLFFVGLVGAIGGFTGWVVRRLDKNRAEWKDFVAAQVDLAKREMKAEFLQLARIVDDNSRELRDQGKALARMEGRLGTKPTGGLDTG